MTQFSGSASVFRQRMPLVFATLATAVLIANIGESAPVRVNDLPPSSYW